MAFRINFTNRKKISRKDIALEASREDNQTVFTGTIDLGGYEIDGEANIALNVKKTFSVETVPLGKVRDFDGVVNFHLEHGKDDPLPSVDLVIYELTTAKLLGVAVKIPFAVPDEDGKRVELLKMDRGDLGDRIWKLDLEGPSGQPVLLINKEIEGWKSYAKSREFSALVLPEVLQKIILWELDQEREEGEDAPWREFLKDLGRDLSNIPEPGGEREDWLDETIAMFAKDHNFLSAIPEEGKD